MNRGLLQLELEHRTNKHRHIRCNPFLLLKPLNLFS
ncbi:hypothetical protein NT04LM_2698, partial [Listeria monocytogenes FSL F2-208]